MVSMYPTHAFGAQCHLGQAMSAVQLCRGTVSREGSFGEGGRSSSSYRVQCLLAVRCQKEKRLNRRESVPTERGREREGEGEGGMRVLACWHHWERWFLYSISPSQDFSVGVCQCQHAWHCCVRINIFILVCFPPCARVLRELRRRGMRRCNIIYAWW